MEDGSGVERVSMPIGRRRYAASFWHAIFENVNRVFCDQMVTCRGYLMVHKVASGRDGFISYCVT